MKKLCLILSVYLFAGHVFASDFLTDMAEVGRQARLGLGVTSTNTTYLSDTAANDFARQGIDYVSKVTQSQKGTYKFVTTYEQNVYTLDSSIIGVSSVVWSKNDSLKGLIPIPISAWYQQEHRFTGGKNTPLNRPSHYDHRDSLLFLGPTPTVVGDTIVVHVWRNTIHDTDFDTVTSLSSLLPKYRKPVLDYVVWKAAESRQDVRVQIFKQNLVESIAMIRVSKGKVDDQTSD